MSHEDDVRLLDDALISLGLGSVVWAQAVDALGRILARYDALMEEHEAVGNLGNEVTPDLFAAHDKVEELLHRT